MRKLLLLPLLTLAVSTASQASMMAYMAIQGQSQGEIKGGVTQKGREGKIAVIAMDQDVSVPFDPLSGLDAGKVHSKPLVVTVELDPATPLLYRAMETRELLNKVVIQCWTPQIKATTGIGAEVQNYTMTLTNAKIVNISFHMANIRHPDLQKYAEYYEISFTYQSIERRWNDGGASVADTQNWIN